MIVLKARARKTTYWIMPVLLRITALAALSLVANAQAQSDLGDSSGTITNAVTARPDTAYTRPTEKVKLKNYLFASFGPYSLVGAALVAGVNQLDSSPPEWKQGMAGYGKRFGSNVGIAGIATTTRYALAEAFKEDTLYYRCECNGVFPRLSHAVISSFTGRRGDDGHSAFSFSAVVAPYVASFSAVDGWYPGRYDAKDALRMGSYSLLGYVGWNVAMEFLHRSSRSHMQVNKGRKALSSDSTQ